MPANIPAPPPRQKHDRPLEVLGNPPPPRRDPLVDPPPPPLVPQQRLVHLRLDVPRRHRIDRDALGRPLVGEGLCELGDGALGGGVGGDGEAALEGEEGGEVDDCAAAGGDGVRREGEYVGGEVAGQGEDCVEVYLEDLGGSVVVRVLCVCVCVCVCWGWRCGGGWRSWRRGDQGGGWGSYLVKVRVGELVARMPPLDPRRVDQDPHLVPVGEDPARQPLDLVVHRQVRRVDDGLAPELLDGLFSLRAGVVALGAG